MKATGVPGQAELSSADLAFDLEAKPSWEVARWLVKNWDDLTEEILPDAADFIPGTQQRIISNQRLLELGITLNYPTFHNGMGVIV